MNVKITKIAIALFLSILEIPVSAGTLEPGNPQSGVFLALHLALHLFMKFTKFLNSVR